jgi:UPF0716 protein FxsA
MAASARSTPAQATQRLRSYIGHAAKTNRGAVRMPLPLIGLIALLLWGALELAVLVKLAGALGVLWTVLLVVGLGIAGTVLVRREGLATLRRAHAATQAGRLPVADLFDGACILVAGLLLLLPGLLSDVPALALLLPPVRRLLYNALARRARAVGGGAASPRRRGPVLIEGEYEEVEPLPPDGSDERPPRRPR